MNRSAKDGARLSLHYGGESDTHSPVAPRCVRTARYGRFERDPRRTCSVPLLAKWISNPISKSEMGSDALQVVGRPNSTKKHGESQAGSIEYAGKSADKGGWRE